MVFENSQSIEMSKTNRNTDNQPIPSNQTSVSPKVKQTYFFDNKNKFSNSLMKESPQIKKCQSNRNFPVSQSLPAFTLLE